MSNQTFAPTDAVEAITAMFRNELANVAAPFTLLVRFRIREGGDLDEVIQRFLEARAPTLQDRGCIAFDLNQNATDRRRFMVHEEWQSLADLEAHLRLPHTTALRRAYDELIEGLPQFTVLASPRSARNAPEGPTEPGGASLGTAPSTHAT